MTTKGCAAPACCLPARSYGSFRNGVDVNFMGFPPLPQEKAERMGHGSLLQKQKP
jgi:hypothetical protein